MAMFPLSDKRIGMTSSELLRLPVMLLHHRFIQTAKINGSKLAIVDGMTGKRLTFKQTLIAALMLSKKIKSFQDKYVGILLPNTAGCTLSVLACQFAGKTPVMINYSTGAERNVEFARNKCQFDLVITSRKILEKVGCPEMDNMLYLEDVLLEFGTVDKIKAALVAALPTSMVISRVAGGELDDTTAIMFTSGSEKEPRGVELTHRSVGSNISAVCEFINLKNTEVISAILPVFHVFGFNTGLWLPLVHGVKVVTYPSPLEAKKIVGLVKKEEITILVGTPFFLSSYARVAMQDDFKSLNIAMSGADKTPESLFNMYQAKFGLEILEGYGATETSPIISANPPGGIRRGSIGKPINGVKVKIADVNTGKTLPQGGEGVIMAKGDLIMKGYFNDPEQTSEKIKDGWYDTGDMGVFDEDGYLWHKGRLKRFVKIGGEMVSLVHVESEIEKQLSEGIECCVVDHPDEKKGSNIVVVTNEEIDASELKKKLGKSLPSIAIPRKFLVLAELPKMGSGKVDFRKTTELSLELA